MKPPFQFNKALINQAEIARKLNISKSYVCLLLSGQRKSEKYEKLINALLKKELV